jgi:hypothetical protein
MNTIIDVRVGMNLDSKMRPVVYCLFDSIETSNLIFDIAGSPTRQKEEKDVLLNTMDISGFNLLAISNDLVVWYYYSGVNKHGSCRNITLKIRKENEVVEQFFEGLWLNNAEAINHWFPKTLVMSIVATDQEEEFLALTGKSMGAIASSVVAKLDGQGWKAGLVHDEDGYNDVQPLLPDGTAKNSKAKVLRILNNVLVAE